MATRASGAREKERTPGDEARSGPRRIAELLEESSTRAPEAVALSEGGQQWSYANLQAAAREAEALFAERGVTSGDRVVIVAENGLAQVGAFLGVSRLGAWPALVNARATPRELAAICQHAAPRLVACTVGNSTDAGRHASRLGAAACAPLAGTDCARLAIAPTDAAAVPEAGAERDAVGALIYTSGTTGAPKGVMATHAGLLSFAVRSAEVRRLHADDAVLGALPMSHIFGVATILLTTLYAGGRVLLQPRFDAAETVFALREGRISVLHGVPTLYTRLLAQLAVEHVRGPFPGLRYAYVGGGALDPALKRRVEDTLGLSLHHGYGMTEYAGSMFVTHVDRPRADASPGELAPDCEVRFVRGDGDDAGPGEPGEIWIRGPGVMLGYYRDPERTRQTITPDGWLKTGDLGHRMPDGSLKILSRTRDIIKRSGFTVYPLEVEQQLAEYPGVRQVGVVGIPSSGGDEAIVAFVESSPGETVDPASLIEFAHQRLSAYKCPQHVVQLHEMPLTANGKIRKQTLRDLWQSRQ